MTVLASIVFLLVQVLSDLGLPRLMSDMVDTGIQAGGIVSGAPEVISTSGMELLQVFLSEQDEATLMKGYTLLAAGTTKDINGKFPDAETKDIYRLDAEDKEQLRAVDDAYNRAVYTLVLSLKGMQEGASSNARLEMTSLDSIDLTQLYDSMPQFVELKESGELTVFMSVAAEEEMAASQMSVLFNRLFYKELGVDLKQLQQDYIVGIGLKMLGIALLGGIAAVMVSWYASKLATSVAMRIRHDVFEKVGRFSAAELDQFSTASLITRTTNDVQQIQSLILMGLRFILLAPIMGIGGVILAIRSSVSMSWIIAVAVISIIGIILVIFSLTVPKFKRLQGLIDKLNLVSRENLSGMMVIRAFGNEQYEESRFEQANDQLRYTNRFIQRTMAFMFPGMTLVMNLVMLLIIWVGAKGIASSELQLGNMMAFMQYAMQIIMSFLIISIMFMMIPRALVSAGRIKEVLSTELTIDELEKPKMLEYDYGMKIEFHNVSFQYTNAEEPVLENISFTAKPGETTAFIGTTGSGKSTLVNLVPRFYDVTSGSVTINGINIQELSLYKLREMIGYVPQKGVLFSGDIASNVTYGKETAVEHEIEEALEVAQAAPFVGKLDDGTAYSIAQGGTNVSGGQRQRLSIARALIKKSPVYIFDDSFSALDLKTDADLRRALSSYTENATILIVAQRVSTIKNAEQIIVLDKGRIVDKGTHKELLASCQTYRDIAESQLTKEELA